MYLLPWLVQELSVCPHVGRRQLSIYWRVCCVENKTRASTGDGKVESEFLVVKVEPIS
jgi:hypothetical protein